MQHLANKVGSVIVKHNRDDMKEIRETIVEENEMCGFENPNLVNVESESRYNLFFLLLVLFSHIV
jgi:hypothetical protein